MATKELKQMYQEKFETETYLKEYFGRVDLTDVFSCAKLYKAFEQGRIKGPRCIDIGAGPLVHRLSYAGRSCEVLVHSDYTDTNREAANKWLTTNEQDMYHRHHFKHAAKLEGFPDEEQGAMAIELRTRSKMSSSVPIDIMNPQPIGNLSSQGGPFDCAISCACLESVCGTEQDFVTAIKNIGSLLRPGAAFVLMGFLNTSYYVVGETKFPCLVLTEETIKRGMEKAGFRCDQLDTNAVALPPNQESLCNCDFQFFSISYKL